MRFQSIGAASLALSGLLVSTAAAQRGGAPADTANDQIRTLVSRLTLDKYKSTIKGLTQFGDRRQGTKRNRDAVDWIEAQLKSYGCPTGRIVYQYNTPAPRAGAGRGGRGAPPAPGTVIGNGPANGQGGSRIVGIRTQTGVNTDSLRQPDARIRALDAEPAKDGERQEVYCTKVGSTHPEEMYIIGGHMDGHGWNEAANDDGSGTALVMELARIFSDKSVTTDRTIRFALWNGEEGGLHGANAYVAQRQALQGKPDASGRYPEPKWLGMVQHDMMMWDHGAPGADGKMSPWQRPEADVNIEFQENSKMVAESIKMAMFFKNANERYATDYPATLGSHMQSTDSVPFQDIVAAISLRENERRDHVGVGWDPNWHQVTDVFTTYTDKDFRLGLNAAQTTLAAIAQLAGAKIRK